MGFENLFEKKIVEKEEKKEEDDEKITKSGTYVIKDGKLVEGEA
jgi:hypothetical protein